MENHNYKVLHFTVLSFFFLFVLSCFSDYVSQYWKQVLNIDILSEIKRQPAKERNVTENKPDAGPDVAGQDSVEFGQYHLPGIIVNFRTDTTSAVLPRTMSKLNALRRGERVKLRIAWLGDSLIEGDLITQTVRDFLQEDFSGNRGVGFVPIKSITAGFRTSVTAVTNGTWRDDNFKNGKKTAPLYLSGHSFSSWGGQLFLDDNTVKDSAQVLEKWLLCGPASQDGSVVVNGTRIAVAAPNRFNRIFLEKSVTPKAQFSFQCGGIPLYGVSMEPEYGVIVDNFSFRGITGVELGRLDAAFLEDISRSGMYDLIVLQYGVNLMFRPRDTNYDYYYQLMDPVIKKMKQYMPTTEFMVVSCSDRAFRYGREWSSAVGIDSLVTTQARLAFENGIPFFNLYQTMGGSGTIVSWAESPEPFAARDYIHMSSRGAKVLGRLFYNALKNDYTRFVCQENSYQ